MLITWLDFGANLSGSIDMKQIGSALVGYWVNYATLTFDLTHNLGHVFFKATFRNSWIAGIVGLIVWNEKEVNRLDIGPAIWPFSLTTLVT